MGKVRLDTTPEQFHKLHIAVNSRGGATCKVPKDALRALLTDHSRLIKYIPESDLEGHK